MATLSKPYTFTAGAYAIASQVNDDFDTIYDWINTEGIHADGSIAFTAVPEGPAVDPSGPNDLCRKSYVDGRTRNLYVEGASLNVTSNNSGNITVTFTHAFPTAMLCCLAQAATGGGFLTKVTNMGSVNPANFTATLRDGSTGNLQLNTTVTLHYIAMGN